MIKIQEGSVQEVYRVASEIIEFENLHPIGVFEERLERNSLLLIASVGSTAVGFKCGYPLNSEVFYSWMGGVLNDYRRKGVAQLLLEEMEAWCKQMGYKYLRFKTLNQHRNMLLFGIKNGFDIVEVITSSKDERKRIVLQKALLRS